MRAHQDGNVVIFILLAVGLFGALAYTFTRSGQQNQGSMNEQQAKIAAQEIYNYATTVSRAVSKIRQRGCSESQINFASAGDTFHTPNPNAPVSKECDIFDSAGGGVTPMQIDRAWSMSDTGINNSWEVYRYYYSASDAIQGFGTTCTSPSCMDFNLTLWDLNQRICTALNDLAGNNFTSIPSATMAGCPFTGSFNCGTNQISFAAVPALHGKTAACFEDANGTYGYIFNYVLLER